MTPSSNLPLFSVYLTQKSSIHHTMSSKEEEGASLVTEEVEYPLILLQIKF